jgi:hypothetical protein
VRGSHNGCSQKLDERIPHSGSRWVVRAVREDWLRCSSVGYVLESDSGIYCDGAERAGKRPELQGVSVVEIEPPSTTLTLEIPKRGTDKSSVTSDQL